MEHLVQIDPFLEGRIPPSTEERKRLAQEKKQQEKEKRQEQIRALELVGEPHPAQVLPSSKNQSLI